MFKIVLPTSPRWRCSCAGGCVYHPSSHQLGWLQPRASCSLPPEQRRGWLPAPCPLPPRPHAAPSNCGFAQASHVPSALTGDAARGSRSVPGVVLVRSLRQRANSPGQPQPGSAQGCSHADASPPWRASLCPADMLARRLSAFTVGTDTANLETFGEHRRLSPALEPGNSSDARPSSQRCGDGQQLCCGAVFAA